MRRRLYEAGGFAFGGVVIAASGGSLIGAGYPGWGKVIVAVGCFLIVVAVLDVLYGVVNSLWQRRKPRLQLGILDYTPEFMKAAQALGDTQVRISESMKTSAASMSEKGPQLQIEPDSEKKQALAAAVAADIEATRGTLRTAIPVMKDNASIMREAAVGLLKITTDDVAELAKFRDNIGELRATTKTNAESFKELRKKSRWLRGLNLSATLNQASDGYAKALRDYVWTQASLDRSWRRMEYAVNRQIRRRERAASRRRA